MKTKSLFRMIVAIVAVMLLSCISTSAYAKSYAGTYTFTDASKKTYTMVLKPGKIVCGYHEGKGVIYYKGKIVDYLSWTGYKEYCSIDYSDVRFLFPDGENESSGSYIKGAYLYKNYTAKDAEHPKKRLKLTKK